MDRHQLDAFSAAHGLRAESIAAALVLTGQRPDASAWRAFAHSVLQAAGLADIGAGVLFFVAANWQSLGVAGRFALLEAALLLMVGVALWQPPPRPMGQGALLLAALVSGGLLALFGQSYQTGANLHELFFAWALLTLPFALAGRSAPVWALWWCVFDVGLALLCGWLSPRAAAWDFIANLQVGRGALLMLPCIFNLLGAAAVLMLRRRQVAFAVPWLARALLTAGVLFGSAAGLAAVLGDWQLGRSASAMQQALVLGTFAAVSAAIAALSWRRDVFPLALLAAGWIVISTAWIARTLNWGDTGGLLLIAVWIIFSSTLAGMALLRAWRLWGDAPRAVAKAA